MSPPPTPFSVAWMPQRLPKSRQTGRFVLNSGSLVPHIGFEPIPFCGPRNVLSCAQLCSIQASLDESRDGALAAPMVAQGFA
jgi:hypothetical protein